MIVLLLMTIVGCTDDFSNVTEDIYTSASVQIFYADGSFEKSELLESLTKREGAISLATTNPDGSPNLAIAVPGIADENHLVFNMLPNQTTENLSRTKQMVMAYYIYAPNKSEKIERNKGARLILELVEDTLIIDALKKKNPQTIVEGSFIVKIVEVLPLG